VKDEFWLKWQESKRPECMKSIIPLEFAGYEPSRAHGIRARTYYSTIFEKNKYLFVEYCGAFWGLKWLGGRKYILVR